MRNFHIMVLVATLSLLVIGGNVEAQQSSPLDQSQDDKAQELRAMHWVDHGNVKLGPSSSTLTIPPGFRVVTATDAQRITEIANGKVDTDTEGVVISDDGSMVYLQYFPAGYVPLDDWGELDADKMITQIQENTEAANAERATQHISALHVDGWLQKPFLDRANNQAYWSISAHSDDGTQLINAIALQLGRNGYEKLVWVGEPAIYKSSGALGLIAQARTFDPGSRYADHIDSDKAAGYGIAALIGAVVGAKALKVAAGAGLIVLLKKFIIVPVVAAVAWVRRFFRRPAKPSGTDHG